MPIGRLIRKIQCHETAVDQRAADDRAEDRAEQHRDAEHGHHATDALRAGGAGQDRHAERHQHAAAEALEDPVEDEQLERGRGRAEHGAGGEEEDGEEVEPLGAEAVGGPAGQRDDAGEGEGVAGHRPRDLGRGGVELLLEGLEGDGDDGDVEDRHDGAEDDDAGDHQDALVELVGVVRLGLAGLESGCLVTRRGYWLPPTTTQSFSRGPVTAGLRHPRTGVRRRGPRSAPGSGRASAWISPRRVLDLAHHPEDVAAGQPGEVVRRPAAVGEGLEQRRDRSRRPRARRAAPRRRRSRRRARCGRCRRPRARARSGRRRRPGSRWGCGWSTIQASSKAANRTPSASGIPSAAAAATISRCAVGAGGVHELRHEGHHADAAARGHLLEHVVGRVARAVGDRAGRAVAEDHRRLADLERGAHRVGRDVGEVDHHPDAVHLAHHLAAEGGQPAGHRRSVAESAHGVFALWVSVR